jgi:hypothetical protein
MGLAGGRFSRGPLRGMGGRARPGRALPGGAALAGPAGRPAARPRAAAREIH